MVVCRAPCARHLFLCGDTISKRRGMLGADDVMFTARASAATGPPMMGPAEGATWDFCGVKW